jgi:hypothetical protein
MSPSEARRSLTAREYFKFRKLIADEEWNDRTKLDHYLAQLAWQIYLIPFRIMGGKPDSKMEDFFMTFKTDGEEEEKVEVEKKPFYDPNYAVGEWREATPEEWERIQKFKTSLFTCVGLDKDGKPIPGRKIPTNKPPDIPANAPKAKGPVVRNNPLVVKSRKKGE